MDITSIIWTVFSKVWFIIPIALLVMILKSSWFKGVFGEFLVNVLAKLLLSKADYTLLHNVTLPTEDGTTQIDHIIVSKYGLFVVETKNLKGWIFGSEKQNIWTQKIFKKSHKFQNPLHQNYKHVKTLEQLLNIDIQSIYSVIVFIGGSVFKTKMPDNVTSGSGYIRYIKSKAEVLLSDEQVKQLVDQIEQNSLEKSLKTSRAHVVHVKQKIAAKRGVK
jgi:restriction system protein